MARAADRRRGPSGVVHLVGEAFELAGALGLDPRVSLPTKEGGEVSLTRNPMRLDATLASYQLAPPRLQDPD